MLGYLGDHIKILVPPKATAKREQQPSAREKRLAEGLRIILGMTDKPHGIAAQVEDIARRALEEKDE